MVAVMASAMLGNTACSTSTRLSTPACDRYIQHLGMCLRQVHSTPVHVPSTCTFNTCTCTFDMYIQHLGMYLRHVHSTPVHVPSTCTFNTWACAFDRYACGMPAGALAHSRPGAAADRALRGACRVRLIGSLWALVPRTH